MANNNRRSKNAKEKIIYLAGCLGLEPEQQEGLVSILQSANIDDFNYGLAIVDNYIIRMKSSTLNDCQKEAFNVISRFLEDNPEEWSAVVLKGYAGTGKTYLISRIIEWYTTMYPNKKIAMTAPTNKAVAVLSTMGIHDMYNDDEESKCISYKTIHKLLGIKQDVDETGQITFTPSINGSLIERYNVIIIDETSMLNDEMFFMLWRYKDDKKFIFIGDPLQIPPVNMEDSIPFKNPEEYGMKEVVLTQIMRQAEGNPIIGKSIEIRQNIDKKYPVKYESKLDENKCGLVYIPKNKADEYVDRILHRYFQCDDYFNNRNYMKVIAWTNAMVKYYNNTVRQILFPDAKDRFMVGESLISNRQLIDEHFYPFAFTSEEFVITNTDTKKIKVTSNVNDRYNSNIKFEYEFPFHVLDVVSINTNEKKRLKVIHEDNWYDYLNTMKKYKKICEKKLRPQYWSAYYNLLYFSDDVSYNYAISAHRSQGSTYNNVLLIESNLNENPNIIERNRIKYTAYTRAKEHLFIL